MQIRETDCGLFDNTALFHFSPGSSGGIRFPENIHGLNGDVLYLKDFEIPLDYLAAKDGMLYEKVTRSETRGDHVWKLDTDEKGSVRVKVKLYIRL